MNVIRQGFLIAIVVGLLLTLEFIPISILNATDITSVYVDVIDRVYYKDDFIARIYITDVNNLKAYQVQINYDKTVIRIQSNGGGEAGVYNGFIGSTPISVDMWDYFDTGTNLETIRIVGLVDEGLTASGSGYLAEVHFTSIGSVGQTSEISTTERTGYKNALFDDQGKLISTVIPWRGSSIEILDPGPLQVKTPELPSGVAGGSYLVQLEAAGGYFPYIWQANELPSDLIISESGIISGKTIQSGNYRVEILVSDAFSPPHTVSKEMYIKVCKPGDANEDGLINKADVTKCIRIYLGIDKATPAADANGDGHINMYDAVQIQRLYLK